MQKPKAITSGGVDRRYRICRCSLCGLEAVCMPENEFYTEGEHSLGPLFCTACFKKRQPEVDKWDL